MAEKNIYCDKTIDKKYYFKFNYEFFILCLSLANYAVKTKNGEYLEHIFRCIYKMFERMNKRITWNFEESNYMGDFIDDTVSKIENLSKNNGFESERESLQCILLNIYKIGLNAINIGQVKNINCNMDYCAHVLFDIYESEHITFRNLLNNLIVELIELIPKSNENRSIKYILQSISEKVDSKLKSMYSKNTMGGKIWLYRGTFIQTFEFYLIIALLQNYDDSVEEYIDEFILPLDKFLKPYGPVWQLKKLENSKKFIYLGWIEPLVSIDEYYDNFEKIKEYITKKIREKRIEDIENWKSKANKLDTLFIIDTEGNFKE
ncbi:hypothetical protein [Methanococcus maripaludis]|uniref:hypothetical protein n=1 Tax=Methanococcus maripaludis TaxID=39152 RepID=UPI0015EC2794|nr:hypothetical protein [Methanococcus maripaludis]